MMDYKYNCNYCDFHTERKSGYYNHCKTDKHIKNKEQCDEKENKSKHISELINCNTCDGLFKHDKLQTHVEKCILFSLCEKQLAEITESHKELVITNKELNYEIKELLKKLEDANSKIHNLLIEDKIENKEDKKYFKDLVQKAGTVVVSVMDYLNTNCNDTPATKKLEYYELEETVDKTCDSLVFNEKNNSLDNYLVEHMKKKYIEKDITKQTFWSTDVSRYSYVFRGVRNSYRENKEIKNAWLHDKQGVKIGEIVIRPFLNYISDMINRKLKNILPRDILREPLYADYLSKIYKKIELLILEKEMVKYMASYFQFDKTLLSDNKKLEHEEEEKGDEKKTIKKPKKKITIKAKK
jgi:hypothetical protein